MRCWKYRRLALLGKITVVNSLTASQLVYLLSLLRSTHYATMEINDTFYHCLWNGEGDKIKKKVMINEPGYGVLKKIDLNFFNKSLKTTRVKKYLDTTNNGIWKFIFDLYPESYGRDLIFRGNRNVSDINKEKLENWKEINFVDKACFDIAFQEQVLWFNSLIRIDNKPIFLKNGLK